MLSRQVGCARKRNKKTPHDGCEKQKQSDPKLTINNSQTIPFTSEAILPMWNERLPSGLPQLS